MNHKLSENHQKMNFGELYDLYVPNVDKLRWNVQRDLLDAFATVKCDIVDCPDLTREPFLLAARGLCGRATIADVGGFANLLPVPNLEGKFDLADVVVDCSMPDAFVCGAGGGPFQEAGANCEIVVDAKFNNHKISINNSTLAKVNGNQNISFPAISTKFGLLGQFLCCEGATGKVLRVEAENRKKEGSIVSFIQNSLAKCYGSEKNPVGLAGVILVQSGDVLIHVMPNFSETPLDTPSKVKQWLKFFNVSAPFIAVGEMVSHDPFGLDLRLDHFHGFTANRKQAGHFHYDTTPETVKYCAYFVICEKLLRQGQPIKN